MSAELPRADAPSAEELDRLHTSVIDVWKVYMTWFTFFFTANLIVMSWVLTETENISKSGAVWLVAVFWIFVNLTGTITSIGLAIYSYQSVSRMEIMLQKLAAKGGIFDLKSPFPKTLSVLGALFNSAALLGNIVVWSYIWGKFG